MTKTFDACLKLLKRKPTASYAECKKVAPKLAPVSYGRAKLLLGLIRPKGKKSKMLRRIKSPLAREAEASVALDGDTQCDPHPLSGLATTATERHRKLTEPDEATKERNAAYVLRRFNEESDHPADWPKTQTFSGGITFNGDGHDAEREALINKRWKELRDRVREHRAIERKMIEEALKDL